MQRQKKDQEKQKQKSVLRGGSSKISRACVTLNICGKKIQMSRVDAERIFPPTWMIEKKGKMVKMSLEERIATVNQLATMFHEASEIDWKGLGKAILGAVVEPLDALVKKGKSIANN